MPLNVFIPNELEPLEAHPPAFNEPLNLRPPGYSTAQPVVESIASANVLIAPMIFAVLCFIAFFSFLHAISVFSWIFSKFFSEISCFRKVSNNKDQKNDELLNTTQIAQTVSKDAKNYAFLI